MFGESDVVGTIAGRDTPPPRRIGGNRIAAGAAPRWAGRVGRSALSRFVFATVEYTSGDWESAPALPENLIDSVARYTSIDVEPTGVNVRLDSDDIFNYPFVWLTGHLPVRFTDAERRNLKRYVERGGFIMVDDHNHDIDGAFHRTIVSELAMRMSVLIAANASVTGPGRTIMPGRTSARSRWARPSSGSTACPRT